MSLGKFVKKLVSYWHVHEPTRVHLMHVSAAQVYLIYASAREGTQVCMHTPNCSSKRIITGSKGIIMVQLCYLQWNWVAITVPFSTLF